MISRPCSTVRTAIQQSHRESKNFPGRTSETTEPRSGIARVRHSNGTLASEHRFKDGLLHGLCREWDENGNLLGEFKMVHGTGVQREWHDNGQLKIEVSTVRGEFCGRNRIWLRDGTLIAERFYVHGKQVDPAAYARAALKDESLPRYAETPAKLPAKTPATQRQIHKVFIAGLLESVHRQEARLWLAQENRAKKKHLLGRFSTQKDSAGFVESLYEAGAEQVIVPKVYRDTDGNEFAEALLVRLPRDHASREKIRKACAPLREKSLGSVQPDADIGEEYLYLGMA